MSKPTESEVEVVDAASKPHEYVTMDELCSEDPERDHGETYLPRYGKWIAYRRRVALERIVYWQRKYLGGKRKDYGGMMTACLVEVMLTPRVDRHRANLLMKADGRVMLEIVDEVLGDITEEMEEEVGDEVGES